MWRFKIKNSSRLQTPFPSKSDAAKALITYVFARFTSYLYLSSILFKNTSKSIIPAEWAPLGSISFRDSIAFLNSLFSSKVILVSANVPFCVWFQVKIVKKRTLIYFENKLIAILIVNLPTNAMTLMNGTRYLESIS